MYLKIIAQYQENYGYYEGKEAWKDKGVDEFFFTPSDTSYFYNDADMDKEISERYLKSISNDGNRYVLIECKRYFGRINDITKEYEKIYEGIINELHSQSKTESHA